MPRIMRDSNNIFYPASPAATNEPSSSTFAAYDDGSNLPRRREQRSHVSASSSQGWRNTLPADLNSFYSAATPNRQNRHSIASYPSNAYSDHVSAQFHCLASEIEDWFAAPQAYRSSTLDTSSFSPSPARNSATSFATTISARSSLVSNDTYASTNYEAYPSLYVGNNDASHAIPPISEAFLPDPGRPFHCTYHCGKTFAKRHEWKRHEDSIHESQWKYICDPDIMYPGMRCPFCDCVADQAHFELNHQNRLCRELDEPCKHSFTRKDKFQLHVQNKHCPNSKAKRQWQKWAHPTDPRPEGYACGFCAEALGTWNARAKHIGDHFEKDAPRCTIDRWDKAYDVGTYGRAAPSAPAPPQSDFYAESRALSDGEAPACPSPRHRVLVPTRRRPDGPGFPAPPRPFAEEVEACVKDEPDAGTLFGDETEYM